MMSQIEDEGEDGDILIRQQLESYMFRVFTTLDMS